MKIALCIRNDVDLVMGKTYTVLEDEKAEEKGYIRVVDESGEDYLHPKSLFHVAEAA